MPDDSIHEIVMRMADGSEFVIGDAQIDSVDVDYPWAPVPIGGMDAFVPSPSRVDITIKAHTYDMGWRVGRAPRDVTPRPGPLPGRPQELPPHE